MCLTRTNSTRAVASRQVSRDKLSLSPTVELRSVSVDRIVRAADFRKRNGISASEFRQLRRRGLRVFLAVAFYVVIDDEAEAALRVCRFWSKQAGGAR